jgi:hypothetical protein
LACPGLSWPAARHAGLPKQVCHADLHFLNVMVQVRRSFIAFYGTRQLTGIVAVASQMHDLLSSMSLPRCVGVMICSMPKNNSKANFISGAKCLADGRPPIPF